VKFLLTNDDGIAAPGLSALQAAVARVADLEVVAPTEPCSAAGHAWLSTLSDDAALALVAAGMLIKGMRLMIQP